AVQITKDKAGNEVEVPPVTAHQILAKTKKRKAKSTLLMAIPDEHIARFYGIKDAKTLWAAIKTRFGGHSSQEQGSSSYADELVFLFFVNQSSSPQLNNEDMEQIDQDDLEEMDLKWQVAMLFIRVKRFYKKTGKRLEFNRKEQVGNRSRDAGNVVYRGRNNGTRHTKEEDNNTLIVQDGLSTYDCSYQVEDEATDFALMAFTSNPLSYSCSNSKRLVMEVLLLLVQLEEKLRTKSSDEKAVDDKPKSDTGSKTVEELVNKEDQAYRVELDRLMSQEKEASDAVDALRKESEQGCMDQRGATNAGSTNQVNTVSNPINAASTLGTLLLVKQSEEGIFISQVKYVAEILKKFVFSSVKTTSTPIETQKPLLKDEEAADVDVYLYSSMIRSLMYLTASRPDIMFAVYACSRDSLFDLKAYSDSDYARANLDRKSTKEGCQFLSRRLILWQCKKQTIVATSTEAEYVAAANCCG
nr:putative ribonuclease H-like domain-containing protein [Tanacetum cinerariifolium]